MHHQGVYLFTHCPLPNPLPMGAIWLHCFTAESFFSFLYKISINIKQKQNLKKAKAKD